MRSKYFKEEVYVNLCMWENNQILLQGDLGFPGKEFLKFYSNKYSCFTQCVQKQQYCKGEGTK